MMGWPKNLNSEHNAASTLDVGGYASASDVTNAPTDIEINKELVGTWLSENDLNYAHCHITFGAEGDFVSQQAHSGTNSVFKGTWQIKSGILALVTTNIFGPGTNCTIHARVIGVDDRDLVYEVLDAPNIQPFRIWLKRKN